MMIKDGAKVVGTFFHDESTTIMSISGKELQNILYSVIAMGPWSLPMCRPQLWLDGAMHISIEHNRLPIFQSYVALPHRSR